VYTTVFFVCISLSALTLLVGDRKGIGLVKFMPLQLFP